MNLALHKLQRLLPVLLPVLLYMTVTSCSTLQAQQPAGTQAAAQPLLYFQKTPCLGPCPAYNAMLYADGHVTFLPFKNALAQDTLKLQLTEPELQQLKQKVEQLDYKNLQNTYLSPWSDISSTYLTFYENGKGIKRIKHQEGGPERLLQFQDWLSALLEQRAKEKSAPAY